MINVKEYNLGDNVEFLSYTSEEEWHKLREGGIGGSDAGAILGINKYVSPLKLYKIKTKEYVEDVSDNVYIKKGKDLESFIFNNHVIPDMSKRGYRAVHPEHVFINNQFPWLRANCDGLAIKDTLISTPDENIVVEIKWVSEWAEVNWNSDEYLGIPASYYAQVQHYMLVTGARKAILYALFDRTWEVKTYEIPFNYSFASNLVAKTKEFYTNIQNKIPPAISATLDKEFISEYVSKMPAHITVSEEMSQQISEYLALKKDADALDKEITKKYDEIMERYLNGERPNEHFKITVSACKKSGFDSKKFAIEHPTVYEEYKTVSEYTRTVIKTV
jgi:putative phage-type endonuclease